MPTYEYKCSACGHEFEKYQQITAKPIKRCPSCGKNTARRLIGIGSGVIFRGSGFYTTDYRDAGYKAQAKADVPAAPAKSESSKSESSKSEPAAKPTDKTPVAAEAKVESTKAASSKDDAPAKRSSAKKSG
jgi:putative FmdB family regulatory protein